MNIFRYVGNAIGGVNYTPTNSAIDVVVIGKGFTFFQITWKIFKIRYRDKVMKNS